MCVLPLRSNRHQTGFTLVEVVLATAITAMLLLAMSGLVSSAAKAYALKQSRSELNQQVQFAMQRMVNAARGTERLMLPLANRSDTAQNEALRDLFAVTLDPGLDRNADGIADADNDGDGRIDEDSDNDTTNDGAPGIVGIDDDNDGNIDEISFLEDDDEDGLKEEDPINGIDDDQDGMVDEDPKDDMNNDAKSGFIGVDDDGDGLIDEAQRWDDDEDGFDNEDWLDPVVFRLQGTDLIERTPTPLAVVGGQFSEQVLVQNVTTFQAERFGPLAKPLLRLTLTLTDSGGESATLSTVVRVGRTD